MKIAWFGTSLLLSSSAMVQTAPAEQPATPTETPQETTKPAEPPAKNEIGERGNAGDGFNA
jgi:hypothetical protein